MLLRLASRLATVVSQSDSQSKIPSFGHFFKNSVSGHL